MQDEQEEGANLTRAQVEGSGEKMDRADMESMQPGAVKRRVHALKRLQVRCGSIEASFYKEVHELERKYAALYRPLFDKRRDIVSGTVEPTDEECQWQGDRDEEMEPLEETLEEDAKGIPEFWLTVFKTVYMLSDLLQVHDEPILKHLNDVQVKFSEPGQPMSFTLEFHFEPNGFFHNTVLTKVYKMQSEPDVSDPFSFEGLEIIDCEGCLIEWHKGNNVTVKTVRKREKHKGSGTVRTVIKEVPNDSFFNFFDPIKVYSDGNRADEDLEIALAIDFEIGQFFREMIVPQAVLFFTGEALDDESLGEEVEEQGDEDGGVEVVGDGSGKEEGDRDNVEEGDLDEVEGNKGDIALDRL